MLKKAIKAGVTYRIVRLLSETRLQRDQMIAQGFVPGQEVRVVKSLLWGRYWIIEVHGRLLGLRAVEIKRLQLYGIE